MLLFMRLVTRFFSVLLSLERAKGRGKQKKLKVTNSPSEKIGNVFLLQFTFALLIFIAKLTTRTSQAEQENLSCD